jgi:hypothetical protein
MRTVQLHVVCYRVVLSSRDSKLTVLIYTGVRHPEQSLSGVRLEGFKGFMSCIVDITAQLRHEFRSSRILKCLL